MVKLNNNFAQQQAEQGQTNQFNSQAQNNQANFNP